MQIIYHDLLVRCANAVDILGQTSGGCRTTKGDYSCHGGKDLVEQNPPIVIDLNKSPDESVAEDSNSLLTQFVVTAAAWVVKSHLGTFSQGAISQLDLPNVPSLNPCCNPPYCSC